MKSLLTFLALLSLTMTALAQGITQSAPQPWLIDGTNISRPYGDVAFTNSAISFRNETTNGNWRISSYYNSPAYDYDQVFELAYNTRGVIDGGSNLQTRDRNGLGAVRWVWESLWGTTLERYTVFYSVGNGVPAGEIRVEGLTYDWLTQKATWGWNTSANAGVGLRDDYMHFYTGQSNAPIIMRHSTTDPDCMVQLNGTNFAHVGVFTNSLGVGKVPSDNYTLDVSAPRTGQYETISRLASSGAQSDGDKLYLNFKQGTAANASIITYMETNSTGAQGMSFETGWNSTGGGVAMYLKSDGDIGFGRVNDMNLLTGATAVLRSGKLGVGILTPTNILQVAGTIQGTNLFTDAPSGGTAETWKLGSIVTNAVTVSTTNYIQLQIGSRTIKVPICDD